MWLNIKHSLPQAGVKLPLLNTANFQLDPLESMVASLLSLHSSMPPVI